METNVNGNHVKKLRNMRPTRAKVMIQIELYLIVFRTFKNYINFAVQIMKNLCKHQCCHLMVFYQSFKKQFS